MSERKTISKKTRFDVFKRDGFACQYCGAHPPAVLLHIDHIEAIANGGDNDFENLITACDSCNLGKGARALSVTPEALADRASRIIEAEEQIAGYGAVMEKRRERIEADIWRVVEALTGEVSIRRDRYQTIKMFLQKLCIHDVVEAAELAASQLWGSESRMFKYFCGVCWNKIRGAKE